MVRSKRSFHPKRSLRVRLFLFLLRTLRPVLRTLRRARVRDVVLALVITVAIAVPLAGLAEVLFTPVDAAFAVVTTSASAPASVAVRVPPTISVADPDMCTEGTCHALRPVQVRKADGSEVSLQRGDVVTDVASVRIVGADGTARVFVDVTAHGGRGRAYAIDPNDGGPVFGPGSGQ